jgi:hypothetical protein
MFPKTILLFLVFLSSVVIAKLPDKKSKLMNLPANINQKAIAGCFDKMAGVVTAQDASDLNSLRVTLERIYQLPKALLVLRQIEYKSESGKKIIFEFNALQNSKAGSEIYSLKKYALNSKGQIEDMPGQNNQQPLSRVQLDKFVTDDEMVKDERTEEYKMLNSRSVVVKSSNFKVHEIEAYDNRTKKRFNCRLLDGQQPLCQCL